MHGLPVQASGVHLDGQLRGHLGEVLLHDTWVRVDEVRALPVLEHAQRCQGVHDVLRGRTGKSGLGQSEIEGGARPCH